jgi:hypothetical protein
MKLIAFNRQRLLRAIHAAAVALFLAAAAVAHAQSTTGDANGNVTITGPYTDYTYSGTAPTLGAGQTLTINGPITTGNNPNIINIAVNATTVNNGTLSVTYLPDLPSTIAAISSSGGTAASTITNNGTASASTGGNGNQAAGIYYNGPGAITVSNFGNRDRHRYNVDRFGQPGLWHLRDVDCRGGDHQHEHGLHDIGRIGCGGRYRDRNQRIQRGRIEHQQCGHRLRDVEPFGLRG